MLPHLKLDDLLDELQARLDATRGTPDRVHGLLSAMLSVGRDLDLDHVLRSVVEAAATLVDAEYAALGVVGSDGVSLSAFHTVGMSERQIADIGPLPEGHGILGELIRHPEPLRLHELSRHPASCGFPAGHPAMNSFVGVPIRVRDQVFGNLYLTEKRGGAPFDEEDEALLSTLAVAAGVAIDNARLYEESRLRERWMKANAEISHGLMSGSGRTEVLDLIAEHARDISCSALAAVAMPVEGSRSLGVEIAVGMDAEAHRGLVLPLEKTLMGLAFSRATPVNSADVTQDERISPEPPRFDGLGPAVAVPIGTGAGDVRGVVLLAREAGGPAFSDREISMLRGFAAQAAIAMELAERRQDAEQIAVLQDRDRIARDLHDLAIQRLFATGMTLQSAGQFITHPEASERVMRVVDDLDETIKIIRSAIFGLRVRDRDAIGSGLRAEVVRVAGEATAELGFTPGVRMEGLLDTDVPPEIADHVVPVLVEALANVARHAHAGRADVELTTDGREVRLKVSDNGTGIAADGRRSGLRNMAERAEQLGGLLELGTSRSGGALVCWHVPLPAGENDAQGKRDT
ncbi:GAF domain-containing protein [Streptomyces triticiradicis]|uniref:GAF domain-containing protein n=2 Tax=Streptomyces triticiradicis TaxID=2651189 RepID=A0A7J5DNL4_9ACTN|nr:GAF domain-containing protein [Streptomyces triticiradicis]